MQNKIYNGSCYCNTITFQCEGEPFFTQYCHCNKCREISTESKQDADKRGYAWTAGYLTANFHITSGSENTTIIIRNNARLILCRTCHSLIYGISLDETKQAGIGINANNFRFKSELPESFKPVRHIWYEDRVVDFSDELPKFKDAPKEQFGSGERCIENNK